MEQSIQVARAAKALAVDLNHPAAAYCASVAYASRPVLARSLTIAAGFWGKTLATCAWSSLTLTHVLALRSWLAERYAPTTANHVLSCVRQVLRFAARLGQMTDVEAARAVDVRRIPGSRLPAGRAFDAGELAKMFGEIRSGTSSPAEQARDCAALGLLYAGGLRRAEACGLELADVDLEGATLRVMGKGNKQRRVHICTDAVEALRVWLEVRGTEPGPLLVHVRGDRIAIRWLSPSGLYHLVWRRSRASGLQLSPHDFRRTYVGDLLDAGADIRTVAELCGHTSIETTARYDRRPERARAKAAALLRLPSSAA